MNLTISLPWLLLMASAACSARTLTIRLYDYANLPPSEIARTTEVTTLTLGHSGIKINWLQCRGAAAPASPDAACDAEMGASDITMRLLPLALDEKDPRTMEMACALVDAQGGHYAMVYVTAVRATAKQLELASDLLLGYVIAHESVHCMLGPAHSRSGLMRAGYGRKDTGDMQRVSLGLTPPEARKLAAVLEGSAIVAQKR
jgi:hypothetical protein